MARKHNATLAPNVKLLTGHRVRMHVSAGLAGLSPPRKGPATKVPDSVVALVSTHTSMSQLNGAELKPRAIKRNLLALVQGTDFEEALKSKGQLARFAKRLRQQPLAGAGAGLTSVPKVVVENRR